MYTRAAFADLQTAAILLVGFVLALPGCSPNGELQMQPALAPQPEIMLGQPLNPNAQIVLHQPFAPSSQRELKLTSKWAFESTADERRTWLLAFPLPGSPDGPRDFHLYLSTPDGVANFVVDQTSPTGVRGFLIQEVGELRGKTTITGGQVQVSKAWFDWRRYMLDLNLACSDGTVIIGRAVAEPLATEISTFERRYSGDVTALTPQDEAHDLAADGTSEHTKPTP